MSAVRVRPKGDPANFTPDDIGNALEDGRFPFQSVVWNQEDYVFVVNASREVAEALLSKKILLVKDVEAMVERGETFVQQLPASGTTAWDSSPSSDSGSKQPMVTPKGRGGRGRGVKKPTAPTITTPMSPVRPGPTPAKRHIRNTTREQDIDTTNTGSSIPLPQSTNDHSPTDSLNPPQYPVRPKPRSRSVSNSRPQAPDFNQGENLGFANQPRPTARYGSEDSTTRFGSYDSTAQFGSQDACSAGKQPVTFEHWSTPSRDNNPVPHSGSSYPQEPHGRQPYYPPNPHTSQPTMVQPNQSRSDGYGPGLHHASMRSNESVSQRGIHPDNQISGGYRQEAALIPCTYSTDQHGDNPGLPAAADSTPAAHIELIVTGVPKPKHTLIVMYMGKEGDGSEVQLGRDLKNSDKAIITVKDSIVASRIVAKSPYTIPGVAGGAHIELFDASVSHDSVHLTGLGNNTAEDLIKTVLEYYSKCTVTVEQEASIGEAIVSVENPQGVEKLIALGSQTLDMINAGTEAHRFNTHLTLLATCLPAETQIPNKTLEIYLKQQSGGTVEVRKRETNGMAILVCPDKYACASLSRRHTFCNSTFEIQPFSLKLYVAAVAAHGPAGPGDSQHEPDTADMDSGQASEVAAGNQSMPPAGNMILVTGIKLGTHEDDINLLFDCMADGKVQEYARTTGEAIITFPDSKGAESICSMNPAEFASIGESVAIQPINTHLTLLATNLPDRISDDILERILRKECKHCSGSKLVKVQHRTVHGTATITCPDEEVTTVLCKDYTHSNISFKVQPFSLEKATPASGSQSNGTSNMEGEDQRTQDGKFEEDNDYLSDHLLVVNLPSCFDPAVPWKSKMLNQHLADVTGLKKTSFEIKECKFDRALVKIGEKIDFEAAQVASSDLLFELDGSDDTYLEIRRVKKPNILLVQCLRPVKSLEAYLHQTFGKPSIKCIEQQTSDTARVFFHRASDAHTACSKAPSRSIKLNVTMEFEGLHYPAEEDMLADGMTRMRGPIPNNVHKPLSPAMLEFLKGCPSFNTSLEGKLCTISGTLVYDATALVIRPGPEAPFVQAWQQAVETAREECLGGICEKKIAIPEELSEHYTDFEYDELGTDQVTAVYVKEELALCVVGFVNSVKKLHKILHKSVEKELAEIRKWRDSSTPISQDIVEFMKKYHHLSRIQEAHGVRLVTEESCARKGHVSIRVEGETVKKMEAASSDLKDLIKVVINSPQDFKTDKLAELMSGNEGQRFIEDHFDQECKVEWFLKPKIPKGRYKISVVHLAADKDDIQIVLDSLMDKLNTYEVPLDASQGRIVCNPDFDVEVVQRASSGPALVQVCYDRKTSRVVITGENSAIEQYRSLVSDYLYDKGHIQMRIDLRGQLHLEYLQSFDNFVKFTELKARFEAKNVKLETTTKSLTLVGPDEDVKEAEREFRTLAAMYSTEEFEISKIGIEDHAELLWQDIESKARSRSVLAKFCKSGQLFEHEEEREMLQQFTQVLPADSMKQEHPSLIGSQAPPPKASTLRQGGSKRGTRGASRASQPMASASHQSGTKWSINGMLSMVGWGSSSRTSHPPAKCSLLAGQNGLQTHEGLTIHIEQGSITDCKTDGIVNSCGASLELGNAGMAAKAIQDAAGPGLQQECMKYVRQNGQVEIGKFALTAGHGLPSRHVYHGVIPTYDRNSAEKVLEDLSQSILVDAGQRGLRSIAFPSLGAGGNKYPDQCVARILLNTVVYFSRNQPSTSVKEVVFRIFEKKVISAFEQELVRICQAEQEATTLPSKSSAPQPSPRKSADGHKPGPTHPTASGATIQVYVKQSRIETEPADAIISTLLTSLNMDDGEMSQSIQKVAGTNVQAELKKIKSSKTVNVGEVCMTTAGALKSAKFIIHAVMDKSGLGSPRPFIKGIVTASLNEAHRLGCKTVALPALGAGRLGYNAVDSAEATKAGLEDFEAAHGGQTTLRSVTLVIFDPTHMAPFQAALQSASVSVMMPSAPQPTANVSNSALPSLHVRQGDIGQKNADAIVINALPGMDMTAAAMSKSISKVTGDSVQTELNGIKAKRNIKPGDVCVTGPGQLKTCKHIIHAVLDQRLKTSGRPFLENTVTEVLKEAEKRQCFSLAIPALGAGGFGFTTDDCVAGTLGAIEKFFASRGHHTQLKTIHLVMFEAKHVQPFQTAVQQLTVPAAITPSFSMPTKAAADAAMPLPGAPAAVTTTISSKVVESLHSATAEQLAGSIASQAASAGGQLQGLGFMDQAKADRRSRIASMMGQTHPEQQVRFALAGGTQHDVLTVKSDIVAYVDDALKEDTINDLDLAVLSAENDKRIEEMAREERVLLTYKSATEIQLFGHKLSVSRLHNRITTLITEVKCTLTKMESTIRVQRAEDEKERLAAGEFPANWTSGGKTAFKIVDLGQVDKEYQYVVTHFNSTRRPGDKDVVTKVQRIENPVLYPVFKSKVKSLAAEPCKSAKLMIHKLWHGTVDETLTQIYMQGWDKNYAGANAVLYGRGNYFARDTSFSHKYAVPADKTPDQRRLILALVAIRDFTEGTDNQTAPPQRHATDKTQGRVSATVNKPSNPSIFVTYHASQSYPAYVVSYTSKP